MLVFGIITSIIEVICMLIYCSLAVTPHRQLRGVKPFAIIAAAFALNLTTEIFRFPVAVNMTIGFLNCFIIAFFVFGGKPLSSMLIAALFQVTAISVEMLVVTLMTVSGIEYRTTMDDDTLYMLASVMVHIIEILFSIYLGRVIGRRIKDLPFAYWIFLFLCPILSGICLIVFDIYLMQMDEINVVLVLVPLVCIMYINIMLIRFFETYSEQIRLRVIEEVVKKEEENYALLQANENEIRKMRHDMNNNILMLEEYLKNGNTQTALSHIKDLSGTLTELSSTVYTSNPAVDAAINIGARKAAAAKVRYMPKVICGAEVRIAATDISRLLGNAIDNAIEGCAEAHEKYVSIELNISDEYIKIHIKNPAETPDKNSKLISRKADSENHGLGMKIMQDIVEGNGGAMSHDVSDGVFNLRIILRNSNTEMIQ